jgi:ATP-dependent Lon protease
VILPERNRKDLYEDIPDNLRENMEFIFASDVSQVIDAALTPALAKAPAAAAA